VDWCRELRGGLGDRSDLELLIDGVAIHVVIAILKDGDLSCGTAVLVSDLISVQGDSFVLIFTSHESSSI